MSENRGMPDATDTPLLPPRAAVRAATDFPLPREHVEECLRKAEDEAFRRAWRTDLMR
jgi:hypothetical protein